MDFYGRLMEKVLYPGWERVRRRPTMDILRYLERSQWASLDELHAIQSGKLRRLVRHAYEHTPFYRQRFDALGLTPDDIRGPEDLIKLPLLGRDEARTSFEARTADAPPYAAVKKNTSGSTGQPLAVAYNIESSNWRNAVRWRGYGWAGYRIGGRSLHYWGMGAGSPGRFQKAKVKIDRALKRERYVDCTPRGDDYLAGVVDVIRRERPDVILCYSQAGGDLARYIVRSGSRDWATIPVICGAERVFDADRQALEAAFGPAVFETYGAREFMLMASECDRHDGLHVQMENMIVEIVVRGPDGSTRLARTGEVGDVIVTDLHNLASPFIRYVNGDLAAQRGEERCSCGRALVRIGPIEGRIAETLRDGRGNPVSGLLFNILFVELAEFARQFQVVQHLDSSITLRLVPIGAIPAEKQAVLTGFCQKYLPGVPIKTEIVDSIPVTRAGKRQVVIVERPGQATA